MPLGKGDGVGSRGPKATRQEGNEKRIEAEGVTGSGMRLGELFRRAGVAAVDDAGGARGGEGIPPILISHLTDDSRKAKPGSCFVAVPGTANDGSRFVDDAVRSGAAAVVIGVGAGEVAVRNGAKARGTVAVVRVADAREALAKLAAAWHGLRGGEAGGLRLVGVTGTNGKTTVSWLIRAILRAAGRRAALLGTIEYDLVGERVSAPLTTPGALALCEHLAKARDRGATDAVLEVSSHALDQRRCDGLTFAAGVFTNLTQDHLDYHATMESYASAKRRLFEMLAARSAAILNADDGRAKYFSESSGAPVTTFGIECKTADVRGTIGRMDRTGMSLTVHGRRGSLEIRSPLVGRHNGSNLLAAAATAEALGVGADAIVAGLESVAGVRGRLERVEPAGLPYSVFVDYAHTDDALRNVLRAVRPLTPGRVICVFGCGGDRDRTKRPRMASAVGELADVAVVTSDNPRSEDPGAIIAEILPGFAGREGCRVAVEPDRRSAIGLAIGEAKAGDSVVIAGKGHEDYQLVGGRTLHFDDAEVAREALASASAKREEVSSVPSGG